MRAAGENMSPPLKPLGESMPPPAPLRRKAGDRWSRPSGVAAVRAPEGNSGTSRLYGEQQRDYISVAFSISFFLGLWRILSNYCFFLIFRLFFIMNDHRVFLSLVLEFLFLSLFLFPFLSSMIKQQNYYKRIA